MKTTKSPDELRKAVYSATLTLTSMHDRDRSVFDILHELRDPNFLDGDDEAKRHGYPSFLTFLTSAMDGQLEVISDSNEMPKSFLVVPTENDRSQFDELAEIRKRNEREYQPNRHSRNHATNSHAHPDNDVPLFANVPTADINRSTAPVAELPASRNLSTWPGYLLQYLRHRLVVLCWRVQPHALLLDELDSTIRYACPGVVRFLDSFFNGNLREFIQTRLPMLTICKIGLQDHVVWNADYVQQHPTWADEFRLPVQSADSSTQMTTYLPRLSIDTAGDAAPHHTASTSKDVGPQRGRQ